MFTEFSKGGVANPVASMVHQNRPLQNYSMKWVQDEDDFVGMRVFPMYPHTHRSDDVPNYDLGDWARSEGVVEAADGVRAPIIGYDIDKQTFRSKAWHVSTVIGEFAEANQDREWLNLQEDAVEFVTGRVMIKREQDFAELMKAASWTNQSNLTTKWNASGSNRGNPIREVRAFKRAGHKRTRMRFNAAAMGPTVYDTLLDHPMILQRIGLSAGATTSMPAVALRNSLAMLFEMGSIEVAEGIHNNAEIGEANDMQYFNEHSMLIYHKPNGIRGTQRPTPAIHFVWNINGTMPQGIRIRKIYDNITPCYIIECMMAYTFKKTADDLATLVTATS